MAQEEKGKLFDRRDSSDPVHADLSSLVKSLQRVWLLKNVDIYRRFTIFAWMTVYNRMP